MRLTIHRQAQRGGYGRELRRLDTEKQPRNLIGYLVILRTANSMQKHVAQHESRE
jgi:hypothetical protein